jgi:hypothetical protein
VLWGLFCSDNSLSALDVSQNTALERLYCSGNSLSSLDVSQNTALEELDCYNNSLSSLDVSQNTVLYYFTCFDNHIPLSDLYLVSERLKINGGYVSFRYLGSQTLPALSVLKETVLFTDQSIFDIEYTKYIVLDTNGASVNPSDYDTLNGTITFHTAGVYVVTMSNDSIISDPSYPAKATITLTVKDSLSIDASLSNLTVSTGSLSPAFNSTTYSYTVDVPYSTSSITLTATTTDANASISGDGVKNLSVGANVFTIIVTAEDGATTQTYTVTVNRAANVGIVETQVSNLPVQVYPNPTTGQLVIEMSEIGNRTSEIQIYDIVGKLQQSKIVNLQSEIILDISHLANGLYYLRIEDRVVKIVKN